MTTIGNQWLTEHTSPIQFLDFAQSKKLLTNKTHYLRFGPLLARRLRAHVRISFCQKQPMDPLVSADAIQLHPPRQQNNQTVSQTTNRPLFLWALVRTATLATQLRAAVFIVVASDSGSQPLVEYFIYMCKLNWHDTLLNHDFAILSLIFVCCL